MEQTPSDLAYRAGTVILCEDGHEVAELSADIYRGSRGYSEHIVNWRDGQKPAKRGDDCPLRCYCGAMYFNSWRFLNPLPEYDRSI